MTHRKCGSNGARIHIMSFLSTIISLQTCFSQIDFSTSKVFINKGCTTDQDCAHREKQNIHSCYNGEGARTCYFCCLGDKCNDAKRGRKFFFFISITLHVYLIMFITHVCPTVCPSVQPYVRLYVKLKSVFKWVFLCLLANANQTCLYLLMLLQLIARILRLFCTLLHSVLQQLNNRIILQNCDYFSLRLSSMLSNIYYIQLFLCMYYILTFCNQVVS